MGYNFRTIVFCPRCLHDVEEEFGFLQWKHWKHCPDCGAELVHVPIENRPEEHKQYLEKYASEIVINWDEIRPGLYVDKKDIFERLKSVKKDDNNRSKP